MELYQLRSFAAVAEEGHLTRAGERLHLSPSSVSAQIKALEDELGVALFARTPRGMALTEAGKRLKVKADEALEAARAVREEAAALRGDVCGVVRIGMNTDPTHLRVGRLQEALGRRHPGISPAFMQSQSILVPDALRRGEMDMGFIFSGRDVEGLAKERLAETGVLVVGPAAWRERIEGACIEDLAAMPWLWTATECPCYEDGQALFRKLAIRPRTVTLSDSEDVMRELVVAGLGLAFMREDTALDLEARGLGAIWPKTRLSMPLYAACLARRRDEGLVAAAMQAAHEAWA